jgi:hypothetical protein
MNYLPFEGPLDLIKRADIIKSAQKERTDKRLEKFNAAGINCERINDYSIATDVNGLTDEQRKIIMEDDDSLIQEAYKKCEVISKQDRL